MLVRGSADGALSGRSVVVKDVIDVAGCRTHLGTLDRAPAPADSSAAAVDSLVRAGADVVGTTVSDELAWSLFGVNPHWGTPRNTLLPGSVPGGSSSGAAAAVAAGAADIGLGTDTGGSIRVPAAWCGLWGFRPTHGRVDTTGVTGLAPSFDTVGWLVRDPELLGAVGSVLLDPATRPPATVQRVLLAEDLLAVASVEVAAAATAAAARLAAEVGVRVESVHLAEPVGGPAEAAAVFRIIQGVEALALHGEWLASGPRIGPDLRARVSAAREVSDDQAAGARARRATLVDALSVVGDAAVVVAPSAPVVAPTPTEIERTPQLRGRVLATTSLASLWGAPVVAGPSTERPGAGWSLIGAPGADELLLDLVRSSTLR